MGEGCGGAKGAQAGVPVLLGADSGLAAETRLEIAAGRWQPSGDL